MSSDVTRLLVSCREGDERALSRLLPIVYDELRGLAEGHLLRERRDHTLQPTALVHEVYVKLVDQHNQNWENRSHFFALAATAMRRILVNHAEMRRAAKRGGGAGRVTLFEALSAFEERSEDLIALDGALDRLAKIDERGSRIVELRFFGAMSIEQTAGVLGVSERTVERGWRLAKAWIRKEIETEGEPS